MKAQLEYVCPKCRHFAGGKFCEAFPDGIPYEVMSGRNRHDKPIDSDNGIKFEAADEPSEQDA